MNSASAWRTSPSFPNNNADEAGLPRRPNSPSPIRGRSPARGPGGDTVGTPPRSRSSAGSISPDRRGRSPLSPRLLNGTAGAIAPFPAGAENSEIAFLGTGSALPSKYRNVSGIWVRLSPDQESPMGRGRASAAAAADGDAGGGDGKALAAVREGPIGAAGNATDGISAAAAAGGCALSSGSWAATSRGVASGIGGKAGRVSVSSASLSSSLAGAVATAATPRRTEDKGWWEELGGAAPAEAGASVTTTGTETTDKVADAQTGPAAAAVQGSMLLDAGEGSLGQMWRIFGDSASKHCHRGGGGNGSGVGGLGDVGDLEAAVNAAASLSESSVGAQQALRDLSAVWISHPHADHHLGLARILSERNKLLRSAGGVGRVGSSAAVTAAAAGIGAEGYPDLLLMGPAPVHNWLRV